MKLATTQKLGGAAMIAGAILFAAYSALSAVLLPLAEMRRDMTLLVSHPAWVPLAVIAFAGIVLMMGGFAAVYTRLHEGSGPIAFVGFLVIELAYLLQAAKVTWEFSVYPVLAGNERFAPLLRDAILRQAPSVAPFRYAMMVTIFGGIVLFCLALVRSTAFPKAGGLLVFTGALLYGLGPALGTYGWLGGVFILAAGCMALGVALVRIPTPPAP
jgi:hypothetical protein